MARVITLGAAQLGPIQRADSRSAVVERLCAMVRETHDKGCDLVVFPELALTTFFPRWYMEDQSEVDTWFERGVGLLEENPDKLEAAPSRLLPAMVLAIQELADKLEALT